ncbi:MAG: transposase [Acetobacteraceae bacterium]|nr:transposase [Acetobacteraceae bacterium]
MSGADGKRSRRVWSSEEKRRIVQEAVQPGASVAEVARRHGLNANLVFAWRRMLRPTTATVGDASPGSLPAPSTVPPSDVEAPEFVPIGVFARAGDGGPGLVAQAAPVGFTAAASGRAGVTRPRMDERPGVIEIDLIDGTRLRIDAFVNERALRRVLAALKAAL